MTTGGRDARREEALSQAVHEIRRLRARVQELEDSAFEPIAVVGIGCRFPGGIDGPAAFWRFLLDGGDAIGDPPVDRGWDTGAWYDADPSRAGRAYSLRGGYLSDVRGFDPGFFGITPREADSLDPQQRLFLEVAWEALEHGGIAPGSLAGMSTAVFAGMLSNEYLHMLYQGDPTLIDAHTLTGNIFSVTPGRVSYLLGLRGPSAAVDTACSSSLMATHLACQSLWLHESDLALAGGVNLALLPEGFVLLSRTRALAADGRCKVFAADADGYGRAEGCGVVVLQRLSDAIDANARIIALIAGSAANQDGGGGGLTVPNGLAQRDVIERALARAHVEPGRVGYLEAHGTGTVLGDPIEIRAASDVLGRGRPPDRPLAIGSVKANLGHAEAAAGMAGLIKAALCLSHGVIPPQPAFGGLNPHLSLDEVPAYIPREPVAWPRGAEPRYAGVSAFGFSGTNVHVVLSEAPPERPAEAVPAPYVFPLSAQTEPALRGLAAQYAQRTADPSGPAVTDICYTAAIGRNHFRLRRAALVSDRAELLAALSEISAAGNRAQAPAGDSRVAFLFSGQGAQYAGMGSELYRTEPVFARVIDRCDALLRERGWDSLRDLLFERDDGGRLSQTGWTQPALFALESALAALWRSWGIEPAAVLGHSVGQFAALCCAGAVDLEDALGLVAKRGRLMQSLPPGGAMAAVFADEVRVRAALRGLEVLVSIAALNAPEETVISGRRDAVERVLAELAAAGVAGHALSVSHAFHSPLMEPVLAPLETAAAGVAWRAPSIAVVSDTTGAWHPANRPPDAAMLRAHAREPVRFAAGLATLESHGVRTFLEIGPGVTLSSLGRRNFSDPALAWLPSLRPGRSERLQMLESLAALYERGVEVDWAGFYAGRPGRRVELPTYPFQRTPHWVPGAAPARGPGRTGGGLLGHRIDSPLPVRQYAAELTAARLASLGDTGGLVHVGVYLELLAEAAVEACSAGPVCVDDLEIEEALLLSVDGVASLQVTLEANGDGYHAAVYSAAPENAGGWRRHCRATVRPATEPLRARPKVQPEALQHAGSAFYAGLAQRGVRLGQSAQWISGYRRDESGAVASLRSPDPGEEGERFALGVHPGVLDACAQLFYAAAPEGEEIYLLMGIRRAVFAGRPGDAAVAELEASPALRDGDLLGDVRLFDEDGTAVCSLEGVLLHRTQADVIDRLRSAQNDTAIVTGGLARSLLSCESPAERRALVASHLRSLLSDVIRLPVDEIPTETPLTSLGMDSLMAMELRAGLARALGRDVPLTALLDGQSVDDLADRVLDEAGAPAATPIRVEIEEGAL